MLKESDVKGPRRTRVLKDRIKISKNPNKGIRTRVSIRGVLQHLSISSFMKMIRQRAKNKVARKQRRINRINSK